MILHVIILILSFGIILVGSELFTNGVEWAGERLSIAEAAVGSLLAAVGTALPETLIPAVALLMVTPGHQAVGVGAIAYRKRRDQIALRVNRKDSRRDLSFFFVAFILFVGSGLLPLSAITHHILAVIALLIYAVYAVVMLRLARDDEAAVEHGLYVHSLFGGDPVRPLGWVIGLQVAAGVLAILVGAKEFVDQIVLFSEHVGISPGILSLILSPLATELPEKYNSVVWIRQRKDHLALANITGAMVFQSCIPMALGLAFSPWVLSPSEILASVVALTSSAILFINLRDSELGTPTLAIGGIAYAIFLGGLVYLGIF